MISGEIEKSAEGLPEWQIYRSYLEGTKRNQNPKMLDKMCSGQARFNWCAFVFGPLYYFYRKQWKAGLLYFAAILVLNLLYILVATSDLSAGASEAPLSISVVLLLVIDCTLIGTSIGMGFAFYPIYRRSAKRALSKWDPDRRADHAATIRYLEQRGGTSWGAVLVMIALNLIASTLNIAYEDATEEATGKLNVGITQYLVGQLLDNNDFGQQAESAKRDIENAGR